MSAARHRPFRVSPSAADELLQAADAGGGRYDQIGDEAAGATGTGGPEMRRRAFDLGLPPLPGASFPPGRRSGWED